MGYSLRYLLWCEVGIRQGHRRPSEYALCDGRDRRAGFVRLLISWRSLQTEGTSECLIRGLFDRRPGNVSRDALRLASSPPSWSRLLRLAGFVDCLLVPGSFESLALLIIHCLLSSSSALARRRASLASSRSSLARRSSHLTRAIWSWSYCRSASHFTIEVASVAAAAASFTCRSLAPELRVLTSYI